MMLFPAFCVYCRDFIPGRSTFCSKCFKMILPVPSTQFCFNGYTIHISAVSAYKEPLKSLVLAKKYSNILAAKQLGKLVREVITKEFDYLVPIPLHWLRFARRGFNQTEVMAYAIAEDKVALLLKRKKRTAFQSTLSSDQRRENVKYAFVLDDIDVNKYKNKNLMLVDDLFTTGSTVKAAIEALMKLEPASINVAVACRVV